MMFIVIIAIVGATVLGFVTAYIIYKPRLDVARTRLSDAEEALTREREAAKNLETVFKGVSSDVLARVSDEFLKRADPKIAEHVRPLQDALKRYDDAIRAIEGRREEAYGGLHSLLKLLQSGHAELTRETTTLVSALKSPVARGRWGEVTLRRVVELAGMSEYCDFEEQASVDGEEGRQRPDMVVRLPGGRTVVVDAKTPLDAYMSAVEAADEQSRAAHLARHAQQVRDHMKRLGAKAYWTQFDLAPDFVVLFIPGESFFSAALEKDRTLIEDGIKSHVIVATPTTLIALLRSVFMGWQQEGLAENAERIAEAGKELFDRFATFSDHFGKMGQGLDKTIKSFNSAVRSWETRIIPGTRRLKELGATRSPDAELPEVEQVEALPHLISPEQ